MPISIVLVDDHSVLREAMREAINHQHDMKVVGEAADGRDGVRVVLEKKPDVTVMDIAMPRLNGMEAARQIKEAWPEGRILALSMHSDRLMVQQMLKAGCEGFLEKQASLDDTVRAIRNLAAGRKYLSPQVVDHVVDGFLSPEKHNESSAFHLLSPREREVLQLLAEGRSTRQVAQYLNVSISTVETHRRHLKDKLNIDSFAGLVKYAIREGMVSILD